MIKGSIFRQKKKMFVIGITIALGTSLASSMLNTMLGVGDKVNRELKTYGANINVISKEASMLDDLYGLDENEDTSNDNENSSKSYLKEDELSLLKTIFWAYNIVDYTPYFDVKVKMNDDVGSTRMVGTWFYKHLELPTGTSVDTGITRLKTWWTIDGEWLNDDDTNDVMVGTVLATKNGLKVGDKIKLATNNYNQEFTIKGIFDSGSDEDSYIFAPLDVAQKLANIDNVVNRIEVSALTTPDNDLARKAARNPLSLTVKEWEVWYCTAYVSAICYQIQEVMTDSIAKPIRQVAESEGDILNKTTLLMLLITVLSLISSAFGISNLVTASVMERRAEIGLKKAIGAHNGRIIGAMLTEIMVIAVMGGVVGYLAGLGIAQIIGITVFGSGIAPTPMVVPIVMVLILFVTLLGSIPAINYLLKLNPTEVLHGR